MTQSENATVQPAQSLGASDSSKTWSAVTHLSAFSLFLGVPSMIIPLIMWLVRRGEDPFADFHGKEAVNFNISFFLYTVASFIAIIAVVGLILVPVVLITWFVLVIVGTIKASNGEYYRYPLTIRFIN